MASKQGNQDKTRPTLAQVKEQPGKHLYVDYQGVDAGGWSLPAPRPRFAGDVVREVVIVQFDPQSIDVEWLDDARFNELYDRVKEIKVWKSDGLPAKIDLTLPEDLASRLNSVQQTQAKIVALSPYTEEMKEVIQTQDRESSEEEVQRKNRKIILPFLKAVEFYESRLMKRPDVLRDVRKRMKTILEDKSRLETMESF